MSNYKDLKTITLAEKLFTEIIFRKYKLSCLLKDVLIPNS